MADENDDTGRPSLAAVAQANTWMAAIQPEGFQRLDRALLSAELNEDSSRYDAMQRDLVASWRTHRDDPLPERQRRPADLAQSVVWLGDGLFGLGLEWRRAHALAVTPREQERDEDRLLGFWRAHRDEPVPELVGTYVAALSRVRQARLAEAIDWHRAQDPDAHARWSQRRGFADTLADEWADDRDLIRQWLSQPRTARPSRPAEARDAARHPARTSGQPDAFGADQGPRRRADGGRVLGW